MACMHCIDLNENNECSLLPDYVTTRIYPYVQLGAVSIIIMFYRIEIKLCTSMYIVHHNINIKKQIDMWQYNLTCHLNHF